MNVKDVKQLIINHTSHNGPLLVAKSNPVQIALLISPILILYVSDIYRNSSHSLKLIFPPLKSKDRFFSYYINP